MDKQNVEKIKHFILPENTNRLYTEEAVSSISLTREVARKINEIVDALNELNAWQLEKHQEQDGRIRKGIIYMKDNLVNTLNDLMELLKAQGFIDDRIEHYCNYLNERLENLLGSVTEGSTTLDAELIDIRSDVNGNPYSTAGRAIREQLTMLPIGLKAIEPTDDLNLNNYTSAGNRVFAVYEGIQNLPDDLFIGSDIPRYLKVECFGAKIPDLGNIQTWGRQTLYTENGEKTFKRYFKWNYSQSAFEFEPWGHENTNNNFKIISAGDVNKLVENDNYIIATPDLENLPFAGRGCLMKVHNFSYGWLVQEVFGLPDFRERWFRVGNSANIAIHTNNAEGLQINWSQWEKVITENTLKNAFSAIDTTFTNRGYIIANMGDSIFGNVRDDTSVSAFLENATGATCLNLGFGGCRMSVHNYQWNAFSMFAIANAITRNDFSEMDEYVNAGFEGMPDYFPEAVANLKATDFSTVDIMTIGYGANDFTAGKALDNPNNKYDVDTFGGALRYSIETILTAFPNIRIVISAPCYALYMDGQTNANGDVLYDFVSKALEIGKEYHIPVVNPFDDMGVNQYNASHWFSDTIHPNEKGRKELAKLMANIIRGM